MVTVGRLLACASLLGALAAGCVKFPDDLCQSHDACAEGFCDLDSGRCISSEAAALRPRITAHPTDPTQETHAEFELDCAVNGCTFSCALDGATHAPCEKGVRYENLAAGRHRLSVRAVDPAGHAGPAVIFEWTVDTQAPVTTFASAPPAVTPHDHAYFDFACGKEGCRYACAFQQVPDEGGLPDFETAAVACATPYAAHDLEKGPWRMRVRATDPAGNVGPVAEHTFEVRPDGPDVQITGTPDPESRSATFTFDCWTDCTYECQLDDGPYHACASGQTYPGLSRGMHVLRVRPIDAFGRAGAWEEHVWTVDPPPTLFFTLRPSARTLSISPEIRLACDMPDCTYDCEFDGSALDCEHAFRLEDLSVGVRHLAARATDAFDRESPRTEVTWQVLPYWQEVSAGAYHTCAIANGRLWCFGANWEGELGIGEGDGSPVPAPVAPPPEDERWDTVSAGDTFTCALTEPNQRLFCWGRNTNGELGLGEDLDPVWAPTEVVPGGVWAAFSAGSHHACGLQSGSLWCWGANWYGQVGNGTSTGPVYLPVEIEHPEGGGWTAVAAGGEHTCAIDGTSRLWCWGRNDTGQLGVGDTEPTHNSPAEVPDLNGWLSVSLGRAFSCGVRLDDIRQLLCWGDNQLGQVGIGATEPMFTTPQGVDTEDWRFVAAGRAHACARRDAGELFCWGTNANRQLARDPAVLEFSRVPVPVEGGFGRVDAVSAGDMHSCVVGSALDKLWCWGRSGHGQLGTGTYGDRTSPTAVVAPE
jgi:alpha-tubulin suppressor-like RCC1 family protein